MDQSAEIGTEDMAVIRSQMDETRTALAQKLGRPIVTFLQAYPGRGGDIACEHRGERVLLRGQAVTVIESRLRLAI